MLDLTARRNALDEDTRINLFKAALLVAGADDDVVEAEMIAVVQISNALGISRDQMQAAGEELISASED